MTAYPVRYDPSLEQVASDEAETRDALVATMRSIIETTTRDYGHAVRSVHAKSHALLEGELTVPDGLSPELAQGVFARPGTYPVVLRLSTNPGDVLHDAVSAPRGLAIKVIGVEGARLPGAEDAVTQDFVMANSPAFAAPTAKAFLANLKLLAATTDRGEAAKIGLSAVLRCLNTVLKGFGIESPAVTSLGGQKLTNPLGDRYYSQAPLRYGDHVCKIMVAPLTPALRALGDKPLSVHGHPNALRQAVIDSLAHQDGEWEIRVQLCTDLHRMPIEDASVVWPEEISPYRPVARIRVPAQPAWSEERAAQADDGLAFSPWHGLAAHQPLGSVNRARRPTYAAMSAFRAKHNHIPIQEPQAAVHLSGAPASAFGRTPGREGFRNRAASADGVGQRVLAGAAGGLVGGMAVSAALLLKQLMTGQPSDLAQLRRKLADAEGSSYRRARTDVREEGLSHGGHLALSAASGALYGMLAPTRADPVDAGLVLGAGFLTLAYGGIGPALRVTPPPWRETPINNIQHVVVHAVFGITTALITERVLQQLAPAGSARATPAPRRA